MRRLQIAVVIGLFSASASIGASVAMALEFQGLRLHQASPGSANDGFVPDDRGTERLGTFQTRPSGSLGTRAPLPGFGFRSRLGVMDDPCKRIGCRDVPPPAGRR